MSEKLRYALRLILSKPGPASMHNIARLALAEDEGEPMRPVLWLRANPTGFEVCAPRAKGAWAVELPPEIVGEFNIRRWGRKP